MIKNRFGDIAISSGLCIFSYHLSPSQVEQEEFYSITPCWSCYNYDHQAHDCPDKEITVCSECAGTGHSFRQCRNKDNPRCLNCMGEHRTLAASCPLRKEMVRRKRDENNKKKSQVQDKTYAAVTKLRQDIPKMVESKQEIILNLNSVQSFKVMVIIIQAHLANMANPGTFGRR